MEAACPVCKMHFEIVEELLQQGGPIPCPTCQVALVFVQPGTDIPLDPQPTTGAPPPPEPPAPLPAGATADGMASAGWEVPAWEPAAAPPPSGAEAVLTPRAPFAPASEAPVAPEPEPPVAPVPEVTVAAAPEVPVAAEPEVPVPGAVEPETSVAPSPEAAPVLEVSPAAPGRGWDSGELLWGGQPASTPPPPELTPPPAAPARVELAWGGPLREVPPAEPAPSPPTLEVAPVQALAIEAAPVVEPGPEASPELPTAPPLAVELPPAPPPIAVPSTAQTAQDAAAQGMDDWATAAARWAASGFRADQMPEFVRHRDQQQATETEVPQEAPLQNGVPPPLSAEIPPPVEVPPTVAVQPPVVATPPVRPATPPPMPVEQASPPPMPSAEAAAPPPLPKEQAPVLLLPTPGVPPSGGQKSTYVLRGSGEGRGEEVPPWVAENVSAAPLPAARPAPVPAPVPVSFEPSPEPILLVTQPPAKAKSGLGTFLVVLLVLGLLGGGGYAGYLVYQRMQAGSTEVQPVPPPDLGKDIPQTPEGPGDTKPPEPAIPGEPDSAKPGDTQPGDTKPAKPSDVKPPKPEDTKPAKPDDRKPPKPADVKPPKLQPDKKPVDDKPAGTKVAVKNTEQALLAYKNGNTLLKTQKFAAAVKEFQKALRADPSLALAHRGLGIAYAQLRNNKQACLEYRQYKNMLPADSKEIPQLMKILEGCN